MLEPTESKGRADHIDELVSRRLKRRRMMLGYSQQELGEAANVSIQQVQKYEKGKNRISSGKLYKFSQKLKVPVNYFFYAAEADGSAEHSFAEEAEEYNSQGYKVSNATEKEIISLMRAFGEIKNPQLRRKVIDLVRSMS